MAGQYTLATLSTAILQRLEYENAGLFGPAELTLLVNDSVQGLHDLLIGQQTPWAITGSTIAVTAGTASYALPADFYRPIRVQWTVDDLQVPLERFMPADAILYATSKPWTVFAPPRYVIVMLTDGTQLLTFNPTPDAAHTVALSYRATAPRYLSPTDDVTIPFPEWVIWDVVAKGLIRLRKDNGDALRERGEIERRITQWGVLDDDANPARVVLTKRRPAWPWRA